MFKNKAGFTLLELLTAIAIIGLLAGGSLIYFSVARQKTRDTQRLSDIRSLAGALELYYRDEGRYPATLSFGSSLVGPTTNAVYLAKIPSNPRPYTDGTCPNNEYGYGTNAAGTSYMIDFCLGGRINEYGPGTLHSEPAGMSTFTCGSSTVFYDGGPWNSTGGLRSNGHYYRTVEINGQCWLKDNLNTKIKPDGTLLSNLEDNSERDCTDLLSNRGTETDCWAGYALYRGDTILNGGSSGARGMCPPGWHIPTNYEWWLLEDGLKDNGATCVENRSSGTWDCLGAGSKLKVGGASGFEALLTGWRSGGTGFNGQQTYGNLWASDLDGGAMINRVVQDSTTDVNRAANDPSHFSFAARCTKDIQN